MTPLESFLALGWVAAVVLLGLWLIGRAELKLTRAYADGLRGCLYEALREGADADQDGDR